MQKIAVVTGAYQGIGKGIADGLKAEGYTVIYSDVHPTMEGEIYCKCDISRAEDRAALVKFALDNYGRIDLLVNNAGVACKVRLDVLETTEESAPSRSSPATSWRALFTFENLNRAETSPERGAPTPSKRKRQRAVELVCTVS